MNNTTQIKICVLLGISFLISCKKDTSLDQTYYSYLSPSVKPYMFQTGSYWVYENDSTGFLDSIFVTGARQGFFVNSPTGPGQTGSHTETEYYIIELYDELTATNYNDFILGSIVTRNGSESGTTHMGQPVLLPHSSIGDKLDGAEVWDTLSVLNVGVNTFYNILEMKIISSEQIQNEFVHDTYLYFTDSIGLVKKEIDLGNGNFESWSLKRWNVTL